MNTVRRNGCLALAVCALVVGVSTNVYGQGKLGQVREAVRESKPQKRDDKEVKKKERKKEEKPKRSKPDHVDHDARASNSNRGRQQTRSSQRSRDRQQRQRSSQRNQGRHRGRSSGFSFGSVWVSNPAPVHVVHHHVATIETDPVIIAEPQPVYESVIEPVDQALAVIAPQTAIGETYFENVPDFDWAARLSALGGTDFADITQGSLGLLIQPRGGLGIDTSVTMFRESGMNFRDHLYLGDVNLTFEPALASDQIRMRIGAGVNWLGDSFGGDAGFNMTGGLDWKLSERWLVTGEIDFGTIGDTDLIHAQVSLGRALSKQTELTFGYNYHDIGGVTIGSAFTGLRFRF